jgi:replicative DNA helicase
MEKIILKNLVKNEEYCRKVLPFLKREYFTSNTEQFLFAHISDFVTSYSSLPTKDALGILMESQKGISEDEYKNSVRLLNEIYSNAEREDFKWLVEKTEKFCKDKAIHIAIMDSISILGNKNGEMTENSIPELLSNALAVSFDTKVGHDFIEDSESRFDFYSKTEKRVPFDLDYFNRITDGGTPSKTLNIIMAGTGCGKSLFLCHHAAACLMQNLNVLYITLEMAEERIAERIDANLLDIPVQELKTMPRNTYVKKMQKLKSSCNGRLIIKEYPTGGANANHFRILLKELKTKKKFTPDIIFVDYLNICSSARIKNTANTNSYHYIKSIAEELRGLAVEFDVPLFSATQVNRTGFSSSDIGLEDTSESFGLPATADFFVALIRTDELDDINQLMVKQLKNRYNTTAINKKFSIGVSFSKMKLADVEEESQPVLVSANQNSNKNKVAEEENYYTGLSKAASKLSADWQM